MKNFFIDGFKHFKESKLVTKIFVILGFLLYIFLMCISIIKINVEVLTPGSLSYTAQSVEIVDGNDVGKIYTVGVYDHIKVSLLQYWLSKTDKNMDIYEYNEKTNLSSADNTKLGVISKEISINNALINAYDEASKIDSTIHLEKTYRGVIVGGIYPYSKCDLEYADIITKVGGNTFNNYSEYVALVKSYASESGVTFTVVRNNIEKEVFAYFVAYPTNEELKVLGITVYDYYKLDSEKSTPKFNIVDEYTSIGSSGGAMLSLSIYNALLEEDCTKKNIIVGTGVINLDGTIGAIGGVKQKVITAMSYDIDIFFVVSDNYEEALSTYNEIGATYQLVKIKNFSDIIDYLNNVEAKNE